MLLAQDHRRADVHIGSVVRLDRARYGAVAATAPGGGARRAEPGPAGPLLLEARPTGNGVALEVWGPASTPADVAERALYQAASWVGLDDDPEPLAAIVAGHTVLRRILRRVPPVRLSCLPRVCEAVGRGVLEQLVQATEAHRSIAQLARSVGTGAPTGLSCWPTPRQLGATPAWDLRRHGVSLRGARALHAAALADRRLEEVRHDYVQLDRRLRALPGVGIWTSGEARLALGDPDAVSVGDYNLPGMIGSVLGGHDPSDCDDALMLELLTPFAGQRGRVIRLVEVALARKLVARPARRAPRAARSLHRYW